MRKLLQNRISESKWTMPVVSLYAAAVWLAADRLTGELLPQFVCFVASAFLMVLLNKQNALIRISTRMVSCSFIVLTCMMTWAFDSVAVAIVSLCVITNYLILFSCYQNSEAQGWFFYAFLSIGMASLVFPQILYFVPFIWILAATKIQSFSLKSLCASLLAIILPYWFLAAFLFLRDGNIAAILNHFAKLGQFDSLDFVIQSISAQLTPLNATPSPFLDEPSGRAVTPFAFRLSPFIFQVLDLIFIVILFVTGAIHFLRRAYNDKLRTRQYFSFFMLMFLFTLVFLLLQPRHREFLLPILAINAAPLVAHFIALTNTRLTNAAFVLITVVAVVLTAASLLLT